MQRLHLKQSLLLQLPLPGLSLASPKRENALDKSSERRELASKGFLLYKAGDKSGTIPLYPLHLGQCYTIPGSIRYLC